MEPASLKKLKFNSTFKSNTSWKIKILIILSTQRQHRLQNESQMNLLGKRNNLIRVWNFVRVSLKLRECTPVHMILFGFTLTYNKNIISNLLIINVLL